MVDKIFPTDATSKNTPVGGDLILIADSEASDAWKKSTLTQTKTWMSLNNVENTALSTWAWSSNITTIWIVTSWTLGTWAVLAWATITLWSDANWDIYYRSGNILTRLWKWTAYQHLRMNSWVTAPERVDNIQSFCVAASDETTDLTTWTAKVTFRMPYAFTLTAVRASVTTAPVWSTIIVDINESWSTILSTKLTIDASEKTSTTAATPAVISDSALADDAEITVDIDQIWSGTAWTWLKIYLIGYKT